MVKKTAVLQTKITETQKKHVEAQAKRRGIKVGKYVLDALEFYWEFEPSFLEQISVNTKESGHSVPDVIKSLLLVYLSEDNAALKVYGKSWTFQQAFQYDDKGNRIQGTELSNKVYDEAYARNQDFKKRLEDNAAGKTETLLIPVRDAIQIRKQMQPQTSL